MHTKLVFGHTHYSHPRMNMIGKNITDARKQQNPRKEIRMIM